MMCEHDYQSMSLHLGEEVLVKKCQQCGKRLEEELSAATASASTA